MVILISKTSTTNLFTEKKKMVLALDGFGIISEEITYSEILMDFGVENTILVMVN
jgi:hypothetical protein